MSEEQRDRRIDILRSAGAPEDTLTELLAYTAQPCVGATPPALPLEDEAHIESWRGYAREAETAGPVEALKRHIVQLKFPIREGMSQDDDYRAATRKGRMSAADAHEPGLILKHPERVDFRILPTMAGHMPVIVAGDRDDFVSLVQAFTERNEPAPVPAAMGACIVKGLNNWSRVAAYRARWERESGDASDALWTEEFQRLIPRKDQYQDRLILLSSGPYSAISARDAGVDERDWSSRSIDIRREHEFTHYFTYRVFGVLRSHVFDEIIADFVGLVRGHGRYDGDLALRCLGLESFPDYRQGGRLEVYLDQSGLSAPAAAVVRALTVRSVRNLETLAQRHASELKDLGALGRMTFHLSKLTLEDLGSGPLDHLVPAVE